MGGQVRHKHDPRELLNLADISNEKSGDGVADDDANARRDGDGSRVKRRLSAEPWADPKNSNKRKDGADQGRKNSGWNRNASFEGKEVVADATIKDLVGNLICLAIRRQFIDARLKLELGVAVVFEVQLLANSSKVLRRGIHGAKSAGLGVVQFLEFSKVSRVREILRDAERRLIEERWLRFAERQKEISVCETRSELQCEGVARVGDTADLYFHLDNRQRACGCVRGMDVTAQEIGTEIFRAKSALGTVVKFGKLVIEGFHVLTLSGCELRVRKLFIFEMQGYRPGVFSKAAL